MKKSMIKMVLVFSLLTGVFLFFNPVNNGIEPKDIQNTNSLKTSAPETKWDNNGTVISDANDKQYRPQVVLDGEGNAIIAWQDFRDASEWKLYAQKINISGETEWTSNGIRVSGSSGFQVISSRYGYREVPVMVSDEQGGVIIAWVNIDSGDPDIYVQRINNTGGKEWGPNGVAVTNLASVQRNVTIVSDNQGGAVLTWQDNRDGNWNIFAQRVNSSGDIKWTANGEQITSNAFGQKQPVIASDGESGAIIAWEDYQSSSHWDVYAQRIDGSGNVKWTAEGEAVGVTTGVGIEAVANLTIVSFENGSSIIAWENATGGFNNDIWAQKVNITGDMMWGSGRAIPISEAANMQSMPAITTDGDFGAIIAWYDKRDGAGDIYARRIDKNGNLQWGNDVKVCNSPSDQWGVSLTSDGIGGAIITWDDFRSVTVPAVYAQRIKQDGSVWWQKNGTKISNPSNGGTAWSSISSCIGGQVIIAFENDSFSGSTDVYAQRVLFGPSVDRPRDMSVTNDQAVYIPWNITAGEGGTGQFRVFRIDSSGVRTTQQGDQGWQDGDNLNVSIYKDTPGTWDYIVEYWDSNNLFGLNDTVEVTVINQAPTSNSPEDFETKKDGGSEKIEWKLEDDFDGGKYRVVVNYTKGTEHVHVDWTEWNNSANQVNVDVNRTNYGSYGYKIEFYDEYGKYGTSDIVVVDVVDELSSEKKTSMKPLIIDDTGEGDYTWAEAAREEWCSGSGTADDPYVIENIMIELEEGSSVTYLIQIRNSNAYFIIKNAQFGSVSMDVLQEIFGDMGGGDQGGDDSGDDGGDYNPSMSLRISSVKNGVAGILLVDADNGNITSCMCGGLEYGIKLVRSDNNDINNNYVIGNYYGVYLQDSSNNQISGNTILNNTVNFFETGGSGNTYEENMWFPSGAIPFGNAYLAFLMIGIFGVLFITKKRIARSK